MRWTVDRYPLSEQNNSPKLHSFCAREHCWRLELCLTSWLYEHISVYYDRSGNLKYLRKHYFVFVIQVTLLSRLKPNIFLPKPHLQICKIYTATYHSAYIYINPNTTSFSSIVQFYLKSGDGAGNREDIQN